MVELPRLLQHRCQRIGAAGVQLGLIRVKGLKPEHNARHGHCHHVASLSSICGNLRDKPIGLNLSVTGFAGPLSLDAQRCQDD
jgi:hypothetical protein